MEIELDKTDIIKEIVDNYKNDVDFLFEIIDISLTSCENMQKLTILLLKWVKENDDPSNELIEIIKSFNYE